MSQDHLFRKSLDLLSVPVAMLRLVVEEPIDLEIIYFNPRAQEITALQEEDLREKNLRESFPEIDESFYVLAKQVSSEGIGASAEGASYKNRLGQYFVLDIEIKSIEKILLLSAHNITTSDGSHLRIHHKSSYDSLTSLLRRDLFFTYAEKELLACQAAGKPGALLLIDMDRFKTINDKQGHTAGDRALARAAKIIISAVRYQDPAGRIGGDGMALFLPGANQNRAEAVAAQIIDSLERVGLSTSLGIATAINSSLEDLLQSADQAMYRAKKSGGGTFEIF